MAALLREDPPWRNCKNLITSFCPHEGVLRWNQKVVTEGLKVRDTFCTDQNATFMDKSEQQWQYIIFDASTKCFPNFSAALFLVLLFPIPPTWPCAQWDGAHDLKKHFLDQNLADYFQCTFPHVPSGNLGLVLFVSGNMRMQSKRACCQEWTPYFILRLGILCLYVVQNFSGVTDMGGGYSAWKESGLPLQTQRSQQARQA